MTLSEELQWRGFINQTTLSDITKIDGAPISFYFGVDPSGHGMQIGNLAAAMMVRHFMRHGHKAYVLIGGATGMIGDPDGKKDERNLKSLDEIEKNKAEIARQYAVVLDGQEFTIVDNYDWFKDIQYLDFLRDVGKHVPMSAMLGREFIQSRLGEHGSGISYAEFSYALIQGYDFLHLYREHGVTLQLCGADQWGNSIAGVDLIRRVEGGEAHVYSTPLVINKSTGIKFGKTEGGAVWLDPNQTSIYSFYQFWLNVDDTGVGDYLKVYTELRKDEIESVMQKFAENKAERVAQKTLAYEVTKIVHGKDAADTQVKIADALFGTRDFQGFTKSDFETLSTELPFAELDGESSYIDALTQTNLASSKTEARRLIEQGAVSCNKFYEVSSSELDITKENSLNGYVVVFKGKKHIGLVKIK